MSRTRPTDSEWAQMLFTCATCHADRGQWCETVRPWRGNRAGKAARWLHVARWAAVREVIRLSGWEAWLQDEEARARARRLEVVALSGGLIALRGELEQVIARDAEGFVNPALLVTRIERILASAKEATGA